MSLGDTESKGGFPQPETDGNLRFTDIASLLMEEGYILGPKIGAGSYSKVRLVEKVAEAKMQAVKIIDTEIPPKVYVDQFLPNEIEILPQLNHEYIIHVSEIFRKNKFVFIIMEYAEEGDLLEHILTHGVPSEKVARKWFRQLTTAVHFLHQKGFAHRDIKCENILLKKNGDILLTDFGLACKLDENIPCTTFCGSAAYASPQILMKTPYDPRENDAWSLGCILYILMCGSMPYDDSNIRTLVKRQQERVRYPAKFINVLDPEVKTLIRHLLDPDPKERLSTHIVLNSTWLTAKSE